MGNLLESMTRSEREHIRPTISVSQLNNNHECSNTIYIMLSCGKLVSTSDKDTPVINSQIVSCNSRLLNQLSKLLQEFGIKHTRNSPQSSQVYLNNIRYVLPYGHRFGGSIVLINSTVTNSISYIRVQCSSSGTLGFFNVCFVANSDAEIIKKLIKFELYPARISGNDLNRLEKGVDNV